MVGKRDSPHFLHTGKSALSPFPRQPLAADDRTDLGAETHLAVDVRQEDHEQQEANECEGHPSGCQDPLFFIDEQTSDDCGGHDGEQQPATEVTDPRMGLNWRMRSNDRARDEDDERDRNQYKDRQYETLHPHLLRSPVAQLAGAANVARVL